jgi:hypothetical protein
MTSAVDATSSMLTSAIEDSTTLARLIRCGAVLATVRGISIRSSLEEIRGTPARSAIRSSRPAVSASGMTSLSAAEVSR